MSRILYISYDGMLEPLGQSQVLGYLEKLSDAHEISLISFEKPADRSKGDDLHRMRERLRARGIRWTPLTYHKSPSVPATAFDISVGSAVALRIAITRGIDVIHARSYVPALMALSVKKATGKKFLFDMRGFWADERLDGNIWSRDARVYKQVKALERRFLRAADHVVTLTHASKHVIEDFDYLRDAPPPITVIPTCADLDRFVLAPERREEPFTFGYIGSIGTWYLFDETMQFFRALLDRRPDARLLVVNRNEHDVVREAVARAGIDPDRLELLSASHPDVPSHVQRMHAAGALIKPCFSKLASAPTKLAEYLGCGVPCVGNTGVGDMETVLEGNEIGIALRTFDAAALAEGVDRLLALVETSGIDTRCRATAERIFSLESGVTAYSGIYDALTRKTP